MGGLLAVAMTSAVAVRAEEIAKPRPRRPPVILAALKAGGSFPQVLSPLSTSYSFAVEAAWITPLFGHRLALEVEAAYSAPERTVTATDPRLPGDGSFRYTVTEQTLGLFIGPKFFFLPLTRTLVPWVSLGVRVQFLRTGFVGDASAVDFGKQDETGVHAAYGGQLGLGYRLGPGLIAIEVQVISSPIDHSITGKADVGDLAARLAYVLSF